MDADGSLFPKLLQSIGTGRQIANTIHLQPANREVKGQAIFFLNSYAHWTKGQCWAAMATFGPRRMHVNKAEIGDRSHTRETFDNAPLLSAIAAHVCWVESGYGTSFSNHLECTRKESEVGELNRLLAGPLGPASFCSRPGSAFGVSCCRCQLLFLSPPMWKPTSLYIPDFDAAWFKTI